MFLSIIYFYRYIYTHTHTHTHTHTSQSQEILKSTKTMNISEIIKTLYYVGIFKTTEQYLSCTKGVNEWKALC